LARAAAETATGQLLIM